MFSDPVKNLKAFDLRDDMTVADLGAGTGSYAIAAAEMVPRGKVYAVEIQRDFLTAVKNKAEEARLGNLECFLGDVEKIGGTKIRDESMDAVIASNVLFQLDDKDKFVEEIRRILKPNGRVLLVDWSSDQSSIMSGSKRVVTENQATELFNRYGFSLLRKINAGEHHYGIIFLKNKN